MTRLCSGLLGGTWDTEEYEFINPRCLHQLGAPVSVFPRKRGVGNANKGRLDHWNRVSGLGPTWPVGHPAALTSPVRAHPLAFRGNLSALFGIWRLSDGGPRGSYPPPYASNRSLAFSRSRWWAKGQTSQFSLALKHHGQILGLLDSWIVTAISYTKILVILERR